MVNFAFIEVSYLTHLSLYHNESSRIRQLSEIYIKIKKYHNFLSDVNNDNNSVII